MTNKQQSALFWLLFSFGILIRFYGLGGKQLWLDEIMQLQCFSHATFRENLAAVANLTAPAPLDFIVQDFFVKVGGRSEFTIRFHAALFGSLSLPVFYLLAKRFLPGQVALVAMGLFAVYPLHHQFSQEARPYSLFVFLALCSWYAFFKALESRGYRWWGLLFAAATLMLYTHYFAGIVLATAGAFLLCLMVRRIRDTLPFPLGRPVASSLILFTLAVGVAGLLFLPWFLMTWQTTVWRAPNLFAESKLILRIFKEITGGGYVLFLLFFLLFSLGFRELFRKQQWALACFLVCGFLLPWPVILFLDWWRHYFFAIRQVLFATPAAFLGIAVGVERLAAETRSESVGKKLQWGGVLLAVLLSLGAIFSQGGKEQADWKGVVAYLRTNLQDGDLLSAPSISPWLAYYDPRINRRHVEVEDLLRLAEQRKAQTRAAGQSVYLVESIYIDPQQQDFVQRLFRNVDVLEQKKFNGFTVYHLKLKEGRAAEGFLRSSASLLVSS